MFYLWMDVRMDVGWAEEDREMDCWMIEWMDVRWMEEDKERERWTAERMDVYMMTGRGQREIDCWMIEWMDVHMDVGMDGRKITLRQMDCWMDECSYGSDFCCTVLKCLVVIANHTKYFK